MPAKLPPACIFGDTPITAPTVRETGHRSPVAPDVDDQVLVGMSDAAVAAARHPLYKFWAGWQDRLVDDNSWAGAL